MKKVIKQIQSNGDFDTQHGKLYSFEYVFEDGYSGLCNHKTPQSPFQLGQEVFVTDNGKSPRGDQKIKVNKEDQSQYNAQNSTQNNSVKDESTQDQIMRQTCLKASAEFYAERNVGENEVVYTAMRWFEWAKTGNFTPKS